MKTLNRIKQFIWWHSPFVWRNELLDVEEMVLQLIEANQEYELLMRNDLRLMFNEMHAKKETPKKSKKQNDRMFG